MSRPTQERRPDISFDLMENAPAPRVKGFAEMKDDELNEWRRKIRAYYDQRSGKL